MQKSGFLMTRLISHTDTGPRFIVSEARNELMTPYLVNKVSSLTTTPRTPGFGVRVLVTFNLTCGHIIFREIAAHSVDHMLSLCFDCL